MFCRSEANASKVRVCLSETAPHENPLIKNEKLRQLYVAMVESRILADHVAHMQRRLKRSRRLATTRGQEACRVSTTLELDSGDLVSDTHDGATDLLLGIDIGTVLNRLSRGASDRIDRC